MSLLNIREKLKDALDDIVGLHVEQYIPPTIILPLAAITLNPDNPVEYDTTAVNQTWTYHFQIQVLVNKGASVVMGQSDLDEYIDPVSDKCIKNAIDNMTDLTPDMDTVRLSGAPTFGVATYGNTDYIACYFNVDIMASKETS